MTHDPAPWQVFDPTLPLLGAVYGKTRVRMLAVGLRDGGLAVISPGAGVPDEVFAALEAWGRPRFLVAPNAYHNLGLPRWSARYPDATVVAHQRAQARLRKRLPALTFHGLEALEAALPEGVRLLCPPGARQGELWLSADTAEGRAWFVVDGLVNETHLPGGPLGLLMRLMGFRAGLITNPFFKRLFLDDKAAHKAWVREALDQDRPVLFIPAHGAVLRGPDVVAQLHAANDAA